MLPSANELAAQYQTTRVTIQKGLSILHAEGYISSVHGKGCFVREPDENKYTLLFNEKDCIENAVNETKLLEVNITHPSQELCQQLKIKMNSWVILIRWLLYSDNVPVACDVKYLPYDRGKPVVETEISYATFPEMVAKHVSLFSIKKMLHIKALKASPELSKLLNLKDDEPLLMVEQKLFNEKNIPIGWGQLFIRNDYSNLVAISSYSGKNNMTL
jgi:GntR family transcriptional regulator